MELPLNEVELKAAQRRFVRLLLGLFAAYVFLITVHRDDFWPFSRFPMFAVAARPWTRGLLRELTPAELAQPLLEVGEEQLPGRTLALRSLYKNPDDLTQLARRLDTGTNPADLQFLSEYLGDARKSHHMVLYLVRGSLRRRSVHTRFRPIAVIGPDGVRAIPKEATQAPSPPAGAAGTPVVADAGVGAP